MRINAESIRTKVQRREEEKRLDMRDMEYTKKKLVSWKPNDPARVRSRPAASAGARGGA